MPKQRMSLAAAFLVLTFGSAQAVAETDVYLLAQNDSSEGKSSSDSAKASDQSEKGEKKDTIKQMKEAARLISQMESEPKLKPMLQQAKGVLLVPNYARAGLFGGAWQGSSAFRAGCGRSPARAARPMLHPPA